MHWIFHKIDLERENEKREFQNQKEGRSTPWSDNVSEQRWSKVNKQLVRLKDQVQYYEDTQYNMLLGNEYRSLLWELERLYEKYLRCDYDKPHAVQILHNHMNDFDKELKALRKRIHVFSFCKVCFEPYDACQEKDDYKCEKEIPDDRYRYKLYDVDIMKMRTCTGCQYMSIDAVHHTNTGGCLKGRVDLSKLKEPLASLFTEPEKTKEESKESEDSKTEVPVSERLRSHKKITPSKSHWICAHCKKGPGNGQVGADHRMCVFEGFNCDPEAWRIASGIIKDI